MGLYTGGGFSIQQSHCSGISQSGFAVSGERGKSDGHSHCHPTQSYSALLLPRNKACRQGVLRVRGLVRKKRKTIYLQFSLQQYHYARYLVTGHHCYPHSPATELSLLSSSVSTLPPGQSSGTRWLSSPWRTHCLKNVKALSCQKYQLGDAAGTTES